MNDLPTLMQDDPQSLEIKPMKLTFYLRHITLNCLDFSITLRMVSLITSGRGRALL